ncbi:unnamed protein product, partial [Musa textilis]
MHLQLAVSLYHLHQKCLPFYFSKLLTVIHHSGPFVRVPLFLVNY